MAKGSPDSEHELIVSGIGRCLQTAYPMAELTFGQVVPDLNLKPDIFIDHRNGQRWAYEVVNKNIDARKFEAKHQHYAQAGVQLHWILWQALGPEKPLDDTLTVQSVWISDEIVDAPRRYKLNGLQRTLARLGGGHLYVFSIHKPFLGLVKHWGLKLMMAGLDIYHFRPDQLDRDWVEGSWDPVPLPYLVFDEQGQPQCKSGIDKIPPFLQSYAESLSDKPFFAPKAFADLDDMVQAPDVLVAFITQALTQLGEQHAHVQLLETEELAQAFERLQEFRAEMSKTQVPNETDALRALDALDNLIAALPLQLQRILREVIPVTGGMVRQMLELKRWFDEDEHLQKLLADM
ncbi:MAG: hypothetical protein OEW09_15385 [Anaerolineae bacterium]|nr:hypothetical protein [Anaerolineae bacterium]